MGFADLFRPSAKFGIDDVVIYRPESVDNHGGDRLMFLVVSRDYSKGKKDSHDYWYYSGYILNPVVETSQNGSRKVTTVNFMHNSTLLQSVREDRLFPAYVQVKKV